MKSYCVAIGVALTVLLASCAPAQSTPPPTVTSTVLPSATFTATALPTATFTPVPPTATATSTTTATPTASPTSTATPSATPTATLKPTVTPTLPAFLFTKDTPLIPIGKGGLIIVNHYIQEEVNVDLNGKVYKIPPSNRLIIFLSPGRYNYSVSVAGLAGFNRTVEIVENYYIPWDFGQ